MGSWDEACSWDRSAATVVAEEAACSSPLEAGSLCGLDLAKGSFRESSTACADMGNVSVVDAVIDCHASDDRSCSRRA